MSSRNYPKTPSKKCEIWGPGRGFLTLLRILMLFDVLALENFIKVFTFLPSRFP